MKIRNRLTIKKGQRFGRLIAIKEVSQRNHHNRYFLCQCDCGNKKEIRLSHLRAGITKSCNCYQRNQVTTHGLRYSRFYRILAGMKRRCFRKKQDSFKYYGSRKISICKEWLNFMNFKKDMYKSYLRHVKKYGEKNTQIDRKDNNGNYCKSNCRWVTLREQARNTRGNKFITYKGKTKIMVEWSEILNVKYSLLRNRIFKGWSIERAFNQKVEKYKKRGES